MTEDRRPSRKPDQYTGDEDRSVSERNRRFGASLRKLYRETLDEELSPALKETLDKLEPRDD